MLVESIIVLAMILLFSGLYFKIGLLIIASSLTSIFTLIWLRTSVPTMFKVFHAKIAKKMLLDVRSETKSVNLIPCKFESGYAVLDKYTKIPVDYDAVYRLDGVPLQTIWRSIGKGLRIDLMAFFDWLEKEFGISVEEFERYMEIAIRQGRTFKTFEEFVNWINQMNRGVRSEIEAEVRT